MLRLLFIPFLILYYLFGTLVLQGNFAAFSDLPEMYVHCQETEDPDMDFMDFLFEHLIQLDDDHGNPDGDDLMPHQPVHFHHHNILWAFAEVNSFQSFHVHSDDPATVASIEHEGEINGYTSGVFHPPTAHA
ncbi:MAG: hypothetical protein GC180_12195 [Bacteroidetes bacterium]|nr:hypothetical protein [Bacteroidota bacterium]